MFLRQSFNRCTLPERELSIKWVIQSRRCIANMSSVVMCCIIFLALFGTVTSGNTKYIHRGEPIQLASYSNISNCTEVAVYINGVKNLTLIGQWKLEKCTTEEVDINLEYQGKIYMDRYRNILISNVDGSGAAVYHIICDKQNSPLEVELIISSELTEQDQIQKCQQDVTCRKNCLAINFSTTLSTDQKEITEETSYQTTMTLDRKESTEGTCIYNPVIIAILVIVVFIAVVIVVYIFWKCACCQCKENPCCQCKKSPCYQCKNKNINKEQTMLLMKIPRLWKKHFDKLNWEDVRQLLNGDQQKGLQTYIDNLKSVNDNPRQVLETQSDSEHKTEDASTEHPTCTGPEEVKELIIPHDDTLCKICLANIRSVSFLPCGHMATCTNCSISVQECPVCRTEIMGQIKPYGKLVP